MMRSELLQKLLGKLRYRDGVDNPLAEREVFSGWPMVLGWLAMLIFGFHACTHMVAAGDTWVAMACGRHFVNHGVDTVEPFSANSHKAGPTAEEVERWPGWARWITEKVGLETVKYWHPTGWVNQNWLTHVIFYKLTTLLGSEDEPYFNALVFWKISLYILAAVCLYFTARLYGVNPALAAVSVCFAMYIGRSFFDVRPAGYSNLLVAAFMLVLALASYRNALYAWLLVPLVVFWANVHGGYIYAFIMLVPFIGWHAVMNLPRRWMVAAYSALVWLVLYGLAHRFLQHDRLAAVSVSRDWTTYLFLLAVAGSVFLTHHRDVGDGALVGIHAAVSGLLFLVFFMGRFFVTVPLNLGAREKALLLSYISSSRLAYIGIFVFMAALGAFVVSLRDRAVRVMPPKAILHVAGAGAAAFVGMVIFNPFHLTNLTHTFVISVSKHAERWRNVHEWNRAFDWKNLVGTAYPFLYMFVLAWFLLLIWVVLSVWLFKTPSQAGKKRTATAPDYPWSRMDLGLWAVAGMTVYMAIRSRRFIPIAAFAACPVLALLMDRVVRAIAALDIRRCSYIPLVLIETLIIYWAVWFRTSDKVAAPWDSRLSTLAILAAVALAGAVLVFERLIRKNAKKSDRRRPGALEVPAMPPLLRTAFMVAGGMAVLAFGLVWGLRFKHVYLDYWPADPKLTSIFMRMTASDAKPFYACDFIRANKLSGKMFNYWTEGGFIAYGQTPDPNTGRTPLQLFMDGRAQAAYDVAAFDLWTGIIGGGPTVKRAIMANRRLKAADYIEIGKWVNQRLRDHRVWVAMMPAKEFNNPFMTGLEHHVDWRTVFLNNKQKLLVDVKRPEGKKLYEDMLAGRAVYPDEFSADLTLGHNLLLFADTARRQRGLELVIKAFNKNVSPAPLIEMLVIAVNFPELQPRVNSFCAQYLAGFEEKKATYAGMDGYNFRLEAARLAAMRLEHVARARKDSKSAEAFRTRRLQYLRERNDISMTKRW